MNDMLPNILSKYLRILRLTGRNRKRAISRWSNRHEEATHFILIFTLAFLVVFGIIVLVSVLVNQYQSRAIALRATQYHWSVGQVVVCNLSDDGTSGDANSGYQGCTIKKITPDNRYYTAEFISPSDHLVTIYEFPITRT